MNSKIFVSFPFKLNFDLDRGVFPMVIQAVVDEGDGRLLELHNKQDHIDRPKDLHFTETACTNVKHTFMTWGNKVT